MLKQQWVVSCLLVLLWTSSHGSEVFRFAPLPMQDPERVVRDVYPLLEYIESQTGLSFQIVYSESYSELISRIEDGEVDLTNLGPLPYVELSERFPDASPLLVFREPDGEASYTCALVTFVGAPLADDAWKGQNFALTQPMSTCGFLATSHLLNKKGVDLMRSGYCYLSRHDEVALSVIRGHYVAGGMKTQIARNYAHLGLQVELESPAFPGFALVANTQTLSAKQQQQIQSALLALQPQDNRKDAKKLADWGEGFRHGAAEISDEDYHSLRQLLLDTPIPEECRIP